MSYHTTPVAEFHAAFGHPIETAPTVPNLAQRLLRVKLLAEELLEFADGCGVGIVMDNILEHHIVVEPQPDSSCDLIECADGLADLRYLVDGGNLIFGFPGERLLAEVHRSNMSKLGADGRPVTRADGKTMKGPNYFKPDIAGVLFAQVPVVEVKEISDREWAAQDPSLREGCTVHVQGVGDI